MLKYLGSCPCVHRAFSRKSLEALLKSMRLLEAPKFSAQGQIYSYCIRLCFAKPKKSCRVPGA